MQNATQKQNRKTEGKRGDAKGSDEDLRARTRLRTNAMEHPGQDQPAREELCVREEFFFPGALK
jgi:hypothetical protein